jgi:hexosaminidase
VPPDEWRASPAARARAIAYGLSTVDELGGWWARELAAHMATYGRRAGYWDEVLEHSPPAGALVFAWRDESRVAAARAQGYATVATPQEYTYFDWAESEGPEEPLAINGPLALDRVYGYEPGEVLGVQGQLWSEYLPTGDLVLWRAYPRLAALAEVGWTAHRQGYPQFLERLATHRRRLEAMGVPATAPR